MNTNTKGMLAMIAACLFWGLSPLVFKALSHVPPVEVLAHRVIWGLLIFALILWAQGRLGAVRDALRNREHAKVLLIAALLVAGNWFLFIWAIQTGYATQTALGFYIFPLIAVLIGRIVFAERLTRLQWAAVWIVTFAVAVLTFGLGEFPWIALVLAVAFGAYGMIKKQLAVGAVVSVTVEVLLVLPFAALVLWQSSHSGGNQFGGFNMTTALLIFAGPMTAIPMILFSYAAANLTMTSTGLISYINPTLQFSSAILIFQEPFTPWHAVAFALIWAALGLYSYSTYRQERARSKAARAAGASGVSVM